MAFRNHINLFSKDNKRIKIKSIEFPKHKRIHLFPLTKVVDLSKRLSPSFSKTLKLRS